MLQVTVNNDESDESYESSWSYIQHIQANALVGHDRRTFHKEITESKVTKQLFPLIYYPHNLLLLFYVDYSDLYKTKVFQMTAFHIYHPGLQTHNPEE